MIISGAGNTICSKRKTLGFKTCENSENPRMQMTAYSTLTSKNLNIEVSDMDLITDQSSPSECRGFEKMLRADHLGE